MPQGTFAANLTRRFVPVWFWVVLGLALATVIAGFFYDLRLSVIGFFLILVLLPPVLAMIYYSHALCRECFINTTPHSVACGDYGVMARLYVPVESDEDSDDEYRLLRDEVFPPESVYDWYISGNAGIVELHDVHRGFLWVPFDAFDDTALFDDFAATMRKFTGKPKNTTNENTERLP